MLKKNLPGWGETALPWASQSLEITKGPTGSMPLMRKLTSPEPGFPPSPHTPGGIFSALTTPGPNPTGTAQTSTPKLSTCPALPCPVFSADTSMKAMAQVLPLLLSSAS